MILKSFFKDKIVKKASSDKDIATVCYSTIVKIIVRLYEVGGELNI